ncbi:MAG: penicillin-insensitive murein endopeptidase [Polyangiaceae bacterium]
MSAIAGASAIAFAGLVGCSFPPPPKPVAAAAPTAAPPKMPAPPPDEAEEEGEDELPVVPPSARAARIDEDEKVAALPAGRSVVDVYVPGASFVSLGVFGAQASLLGFDVVEATSAEGGALVDDVLGPLRARRPLDEDSLLPRVVSFRSPAGALHLRVLVDASGPVELRRVAAPLVEPVVLPKKGKPPPMFLSPVIGFPAPGSRDDGYFLQSSARYQFARTDVIAVLLAAFEKTRSRYRRDPIAIADISQWNGIRPATDLGAPRHISHEGGRDVDIALAASDGEASTVRAHCTGVLVEESVQACGPGTVRGFDAARMAYFLGLLFETSPPVEKIFVDDVYLRELRRAAETLHERRLLKDPGFEGLYDDAIVRPSPWHTDHLHVRFAGPAGKPAF